MAEPDDDEPTDADYSAALRLARKHFYDGNEPYAGAVRSFARMLGAYRQEQATRGPWTEDDAERFNAAKQAWSKDKGNTGSTLAALNECFPQGKAK